MEFRLLGELEIEDGGQSVRIARAKERALLALLALHANEVVSRDLLIGELWGEGQPASAKHTLEGYLSRLRKALAAADQSELIESRPGGYRLRLDPEHIDVERFERLVAEGREALEANAPADADERLGAALALWRGEALADLAAEPFALVAAARLEELRLDAIELRNEARLRLGRDAVLVADLESAVARHPLRERLRGQLMLALYRAGRQADALATYQEGWRQLVGELGIEPGAELQELQRAILRQDPGLGVPRAGTTAGSGNGGQSAPHGNLAPELTSFVGREQELQALEELVGRERLVTVDGLGGIGKTRLALRAAAELADRFPDGVWHVDCTPVASREALIGATIRAIGFPVDACGQELDSQAQLLDYLAQRSLLVVLDNFEHLVGSAGLLLELLDRAPGVSLLVTSRERLNLREEWVFDLEGLPYADDGGGASRPAAARLFLDRAYQAGSGAVPALLDTASVGRVCRLVEGVPLAVELAAAWTSVLSCDEIADEVERSLDFLTTTAHDTSAQHRNLRAVFERSWSLLAEDEREALMQLALFSGGCQRDAALEVAGVDVSLLAALVRASLLRHDPDGRFSMHELVRQYAREKLAATRQDAFLDRHADYYTHFLAERGPALVGELPLGPTEEVAAEHANVGAALLHAAASWDDDRALSALTALSFFGHTQNPGDAATIFDEVVQLLEERGATLARGSGGSKPLAAALAWKGYFEAFCGQCSSERTLRRSLPAIRVMGLRPELGVTLLALGMMAFYESRYDEAVPALEESLGVFRDERNDLLTAACLLWLGWIYQDSGESDRAGSVYREAYELTDRHGYALVRAYTLSKLGMWADGRREYAEAWAYHERARAAFDALENDAGRALAVSRMSVSAWGLGEHSEAERLGRESLELFDAIGHRWGVPAAHCRIGLAQLAQGRCREARDSFEIGLRLAAGSHLTGLQLYALVGIAGVLAREGDPERAAGLLLFALAHPATPEDYRVIARRELAEVESELTREALAEAREPTAAWTLDAVSASMLDRSLAGRGGLRRARAGSVDDGRSGQVVR
jgi:DNA-binding SARP family transcriptional activator/predicted ATPase